MKLIRKFKYSRKDQNSQTFQKVRILELYSLTTVKPNLGYIFAVYLVLSTQMRYNPRICRIRVINIVEKLVAYQIFKILLVFSEKSVILNVKDFFQFSEKRIKYF